MVLRSIAVFRSVISSLTFKVMAICFLSIHVPLIATIVYLSSGFSSQPLPIFILLLSATLVGTAACLVAVWWINRPLMQLSSAVKTYRSEGKLFQMNLKRKDEIGDLANSVSAMVVEVDGLLTKLHRQANTDLLTGLGNRRWLGDRMIEEMARATRLNEPFSAILFDLDHFKSINDRYGHEVGDHVLIAVGAVVRDSLRQYDLAARIGGEEFFLGLPRTDIAQAGMIAERLRGRLEALSLDPLPAGGVTASFGLFEATNGETLRQILSGADKALYEAKRNGRNRVTVMS